MNDRFLLLKNWTEGSAVRVGSACPRVKVSKWLMSKFISVKIYNKTNNKRKIIYTLNEHRCWVTLDKNYITPTSRIKEKLTLISKNKSVALNYSLRFRISLTSELFLSYYLPPQAEPTSHWSSQLPVKGYLKIWPFETKFNGTFQPFVARVRCVRVRNVADTLRTHMIRRKRAGG